MMMDSQTIEKVEQSELWTLPSLHHNMHLSQLEKKYGGKADNIIDYWPPKLRSDQFGIDQKRLLEHEKEEEGAGASRGQKSMLKIQGVESHAHYIKKIETIRGNKQESFSFEDSDSEESSMMS